MDKVFLSRRNLLTLLSKLDRRQHGDDTMCVIIKCDNFHPLYSQTMPEIAVGAVEDEDYYTDRPAGPVDPKDEPHGHH